jgi:NAD(P)-dependent dehydrogenase (short-subunit alcohol dehydrogenase family)
MRLSGRVVVVTGARRDMADETGAAMEREAAIVVRAGLDGDAIAFIADVLAVHGRIDVLCCIGPEGAVPWCEAAAPAIARSGGGSIIAVVTSRALAGDVRGGDESVAGGAVVALMRSLATRYGKDGVRANAIAVPPADLEIDMVRRSTLLPRLLRPDDVAHLAVFLASADAAFVTGQVVRCDGGLLAHLPHYASLVAQSTTTIGG